MQETGIDQMLTFINIISENLLEKHHHKETSIQVPE